MAPNNSSLSQRWCRLPRVDQTTLTIALISPVSFTFVALLILGRPLRQLAQTHSFFARVQVVFLCLEVLEMLGTGLYSLQSGLLQQQDSAAANDSAAVRIGSLVFLAGGRATQRVGKILLIFLTMLRIVALQAPMRFRAIKQGK